MGNSDETANLAVTAMRAYVMTLFDEMQQRVAHQRAVVLQCLDGLTAPNASANTLARRLRGLENAVREAIDVLEETKRSFKSKRLGELREKLAQVLAEQDM